MFNIGSVDPPSTGRRSRGRRRNVPRSADRSGAGRAAGRTSGPSQRAETSHPVAKVGGDAFSFSEKVPAAGAFGINRNPGGQPDRAWTLRDATNVSLGGGHTWVASW